jgi:eukaryotic-like serine/threonine-protein kinase
VRYEPVARLGRGGMGVVDLARDDDGRDVACKRLTLHGSAADVDRARRRIRREAEVLAGLEHPNVVRLLDVVDEGGEVVLVMPYLTGGTLADRVGHHGPAPAEEVERLAEALLGALAAAHRAGVVHRDIKPGNVLFDQAGTPHLADFGVAATRDVTDGLTAAGTVVGTPAFMAPEQARGEDAGQAADVFSLGATLLFAATGEGPYGRGDPRLVLHRAAKGRVGTVPRTLPPRLRRLLQQMLDPRADRRPTAAALAGGPEGTVALPAARPGRRRLLVGAGAVAVLALLGVGIALAGSRGGDRVVEAADVGEAAGEETTPTTAPCVPLPYRPCGGADAPNTDGVACLPGYDDYDGDPATGCEAAPDGLVDGTPLIDRIEGTIVPRDDVDRFSVEVEDRWQLLCDGVLTLTLTAPEGMTLRLEVFDRSGEVLLGEAVSTGGLPGEVVLPEPSCARDDSTTLLAVVRPVGSDRVAEPYVLEREGSW